jgi:hypothetical protein
MAVGAANADIHKLERQELTFKTVTWPSIGTFMDGAQLTYAGLSVAADDGWHFSVIAFNHFFPGFRSFVKEKSNFDDVLAKADDGGASKDRTPPIKQYEEKPSYRADSCDLKQDEHCITDRNKLDQLFADSK